MRRFLIKKNSCMLVYLLVILLIIIFRNRLGLAPNLYSKNENMYVIITCSIFVLLAALRWIIPGTDIEGFVGDYRRMQIYSYSEIWENWRGNYVVYYSICKIFGATSLPYQFWFGFVQLVAVSGFVRIINRFSLDRLFCLLLYFTMGLFAFSIVALKQAFAMGLVWHAYAFLYDKKYMWAILLAILAYYSHKTSAIFILSFAMLFMRKRIYSIITILIILAIALAPSYLLSFISTALGDEHYSSYLQNDGAYSYTVFLFNLALFSIAYFTKHKFLRHSQFIISMASIALVINLFSQVSASAFRLAFYYTPFLIIFVSNNVQDRNLRLLVMLFTSFFLLYTGRQYPYQFFWQ